MKIPPRNGELVAPLSAAYFTITSDTLEENERIIARSALAAKQMKECVTVDIAAHSSLSYCSTQYKADRFYNCEHTQLKAA